MASLDLEAAIREDVVVEVLTALTTLVKAHSILAVDDGGPGRFAPELVVRCACGETFGAYRQATRDGGGIYLGGYSDHLAGMIR